MPKRTPWTRRRAIAVAVLTFVFGILLGPGALWQWRIAAKQQVLEENRQQLELRSATATRFAEIFGMFAEFVPAANACRQMESDYGFCGTVMIDTDQKRAKWAEYQELRKKRNGLKTRLDFLIEDYNALETTLAAQEGRKPRPLPVSFSVPSAPKLITVAP